MNKIKYLIIGLLLPGFSFAGLKQNQDLPQEGVMFVKDVLVVVQPTKYSKCPLAKWFLDNLADLDSKGNCFVIQNDTVRVCATEEKIAVNKLAINWRPVIILPGPGSGPIFIESAKAPTVLRLRGPGVGPIVNKSPTILQLHGPDDPSLELSLAYILPFDPNNPYDAPPPS